MPLYACARCGFTSAAFRVDAARAHRLGYPECDGSLRIVFRSDERYRSHKHGSAAAAPGAIAVGAATGAHPGGGGERAFEMLEHPDADGTLRLTLLGDLDLEVADSLRARLAEFRASGRPVCLDLSRLAFIDSSGVQALLGAVTDARWHGWQLEVARQVSPTVRRATEIVGIAQVLWPPAAAEPG